jgi:hypothetical protein
MTHAEASSNFTQFKTTVWTDDKGVKMTSAQISSQYSKLYDRERILRKSQEQEKKNQEQQAEIDRLKGLLEGKSGKKA